MKMLEVAQQQLYQKLDAIQKCYQVVDLSLKDIYAKEKEACSARSKFQEVLIWKKRVATPALPLLSHSEQVIGEMALKYWETNLGESKKLSRDVKEDFLEALSSINKNLIEFEGNNITEALG
jgi:hypothetical protein